jgi:putative holliday junction resolvase
MRVLGVDIGLKRTGLALSDETGTAIRLLPNLVANSRAKALEKILGLVVDFTIKVVVIGCPDPKTSGSKAIASRAIGLKQALDDVFKERGLDTKTYVWDEEMTSKKASAQLVESGVPKKKRSAMLDAASAAILVEEFLLSHAEKS